MKKYHCANCNAVVEYDVTQHKTKLKCPSCNKLVFQPILGRLRAVPVMIGGIALILYYIVDHIVDFSTADYPFWVIMMILLAIVVVAYIAAGLYENMICNKQSVKK